MRKLTRLNNTGDGPLMVQQIDFASRMDVRLLRKICVEQYVIWLLKAVTFTENKLATHTFKSWGVDSQDHGQRNQMASNHAGSQTDVRNLLQPVNQFYRQI